MNLNKKGFTLVELLAGVVIVGLIMGIGLVSYSSLIGESRNRVYENYMDTVHDELEMYFIENPIEIPNDGNTLKLYLHNLEISPIINPDNSNDTCRSNDNSNDSYIEVSRDDSSYGTIALKYKVCLKCQSFNKCKNY